MTLFKILYHPSVQRTKSDIEGLKDYFTSRLSKRGPDRRLAKAGAVRLDLVQQAVEATQAVTVPIFNPLDWNKDFSGETRNH